MQGHLNLIRGAFLRPREVWRWAFVGGLVAGARVAAVLHPAAFVAPTPAFGVSVLEVWPWNMSSKFDLESDCRAAPGSLCPTPACTVSGLTVWP